MNGALLSNMSQQDMGMTVYNGVSQFLTVVEVPPARPCLAEAS